jgi:hypothetical protein
VNNLKSNNLEVTCGVPQGSALGPLLFLLYINDLPNALAFGQMRLFADDANDFIVSKDIEILKEHAQIELTTISEWMNANLLTINFSKTNFTIFSPTRKPLDFHILNSIQFKTTNIQRVVSIKYLGLFIDESLCWKEHVLFICNKIRRFVGLFYKLRCFVPNQTLRIIYFALVYSILQYGVEIYANVPVSVLNPLQILNNRILRVLQNGSIYSKIVDLYSNYNVLPIQLLHNFRICIFVYKFLYFPDTLPLGFKTYFTQNTAVHTYNTRSATNLHMIRCNSRQGSRSLQYKAAELWNALGTDLKSITTLSLFKKQLKCYYIIKIRE